MKLGFPEAHQHSQSHCGHGELSQPEDQCVQHAEFLAPCSTSSESALGKLAGGKSEEVQEKLTVFFFFFLHQ